MDHREIETFFPTKVLISYRPSGLGWGSLRRAHGGGYLAAPARVANPLPQDRATKGLAKLGSGGCNRIRTCLACWVAADWTEA